MKKIILIFICIFSLFGCQKKEEVKEYMMFKTTREPGTERAFTLTWNEWISQETIAKIKSDENIIVDDAYILPLSYSFTTDDIINNIMESPIEWSLKVDGKEIRNTETGLGISPVDPTFIIPYQYYAISPFKNIEKLESYCMALYDGEITDYIPIYLPITSIDGMGLDEYLTQSFSQQILLTIPVRLPTRLIDGKYETKRELITFQVKGIFNTDGSIATECIPLEYMNKLIDENKEEDLEPMGYILTTTNSKAKEVAKSEKYLYVKERWNDKGYDNKPIGIVND